MTHCLAICSCVDVNDSKLLICLALGPCSLHTLRPVAHPLITVNGLL
jgi:hypothetical protein